MATSEPPRVLIGGVGLPWRRDLDLGRLLMEQVEGSDWPEDVSVEDLSYSAHRVMHTLEEISPRKLILVGATSKGRKPGTITTRSIDDWDDSDEEDVVARLGESVGGVIDLDHIVVVNRHFGSLPEDTVVIEVEAGDQSFGTGYSPDVEDVIPRILEAIRQEVR